MTTCPKKRFLHYASDWKGFEMERDEVNLRTKTKVPIRLEERKLLPQQMHKQKCKLCSQTEEGHNGNGNGNENATKQKA